MSPTLNYQDIKPLQKGFERESFDCGVEVLNDYLKRYALQNQKKDATRTYVATDTGNKILGYYTLVFGSVVADEVPENISSGLGRFPIPVIVLARLAVDQSQKGKGLGGILLQDAMLRALQAAEIAGLRAITVQAKDENVRSFYEKTGFIRSPSDPMQLFLKISELRANKKQTALIANSVHEKAGMCGEIGRSNEAFKTILLCI